MVKLCMPNQEEVATWLSLHNPEKHQLLQNISASRPRTLLGGIGNPALSGGAGTGDDLEQAQKDDIAVKKIIDNPQGQGGQLTPQQYQEALNIFKKNPISGCSSVLTMARSSSGFNPLSNDVTGQEPKFQKYLENVSKSPFFEIPFSSTTTIKQTSQDFDKVIDDIVALYEGITTGDKGKIKDSLVQMAKAATSRKETQQRETLFAQNTIQGSGSDVTVYICYSTVQMTLKDEKSTSSQTDYQIVQARLKFFVDFWPIYAEQVMNINYTAVTNWLQDMTTPPGNAGSQKFCLN